MINNAGHTEDKFYSLLFNGSTAFMSIAGSDTFTSGLDVEFTMVTSLRLLSDTALQTLYSSYHGGGVPADDRNIWLLFNSSNEIQLSIRTGATSEVWKTTNTFTAGSDYLIALRVSALSNTVELDVNGVSQTFSTAGTVPNPIQAQTTITPSIMANTNTGGGPSFLANGELYYWALSSKLLSNAEVLALDKGFMNVTDQLEYEVDASKLYVNSPIGGNIYITNDNYSSASYLTKNNPLGALTA